MFFLGLDIGSSSIKAALVEAESGRTVARALYPEHEMAIQAPRPGWAEQDPEQWWQCVGQVVRLLFEKNAVSPAAVQAIGISYQMHGLVVVDENLRSLRPAIIWCDSRAVGIGDAAFSRLGGQDALPRLLNSPGNFTASKLRWVQENEPDLYKKIRYFMLPGDYVAMRLTGEPLTTISGLSEGILWDFFEKKPAETVLRDFDIDPKLIPPLAPTFGLQGRLSAAAAAELGLPAGIPVAYRAGDQPNNALSLNVLEPGEVAATGGTSGVVYVVSEQPVFDPLSRVNGFAHVNYLPERPSIGILMCINGAGITFRWLRQHTGNAAVAYSELERRAAAAPVGADGLSLLPFGNGAERILQNRDVGANLTGLNFNRHGEAHILRAGIEGMAFAFLHGMEILKGMGLDTQVIRVGDDNLFQSRIFSETIATLSGSRIEMLHTNGAVGAAKGAGFGAGFYSTLREAVGTAEPVGTVEPLAEKAAYEDAYRRWSAVLDTFYHL